MHTFVAPEALPLIGKVRCYDKVTNEYFVKWQHREFNMLQAIYPFVTELLQSRVNLKNRKNTMSLPEYRMEKMKITQEAMFSAPVKQILSNLDTNALVINLSRLRHKKYLTIFQTTMSMLLPVFLYTKEENTVIIVFSSKANDLPLYWMRVHLLGDTFSLRYFSKSVAGQFALICMLREPASSGGPIVLSLMKHVIDMFYLGTTYKMYVTALKGTQIALQHEKLRGGVFAYASDRKKTDGEVSTFIFPNGFATMWQNWIEEPVLESGKRGRKQCGACALPTLGAKYCSTHCFENKGEMI